MTRGISQFIVRVLKWRLFRPIAVLAGLAAASLLLVPTPIGRLLSTTEFLPHATCYLRNSRLIWLHASSDMVIGLSYVAISSTLAYLVYKARREIPFHWMFLAFGLFIVTCGFTHFMEVWTVWQPVYWFSGYVKVITALASLTTAVLLPPLIPKVIALVHSAQLSEQRKRDLERSNRDLALANEELKAFTYSASHDLRAPLRTMGSMSALLTESLPASASAESKMFAERIQAGAERMNRMLDDLLAYSGFHQIEAPLTKIETERLIRDVLNDLESDLKSKKVIVHIAGPIPLVQANGTLLKIIFANLIGNAAEYVPAERRPEIRVEAKTDGDVVEISVRDNGYGIPKQYQRKIFQPFERLHRAEEHPGTGLGLAIVTRATQRMNGEIGVESELGQGSRFGCACAALK